jgi:integrase
LRRCGAGVGWLVAADQRPAEWAARRRRRAGRVDRTRTLARGQPVGAATPPPARGPAGGPVFLASRRPTRAVAALDVDPTSGRTRLSYQRAAELVRVRTGWTLHQLRHSALTHAAEDGTNLPLLLARSRHASVRSPERYARPRPEAVAASCCCSSAPFGIHQPCSEISYGVGRDATRGGRWDRC